MRWNAPEDFQTRRHLPAQTDDLFVSVMIRGFRRVALACGSGSGPIETHDSVRVKFESTRAVRTARIERRSTDRPTRVQIPNGNRAGPADVFSSLACFVLLTTPMMTVILPGVRVRRVQSMVSCAAGTTRGSVEDGKSEDVERVGDSGSTTTAAEGEETPTSSDVSHCPLFFSVSPRFIGPSISSARWQLLGSRRVSQYPRTASRASCPR